MNKDRYLGFEQLDSRKLLSSNPWYIDTIKAPEVWSAFTASNSKPIVAIVDSVDNLNLVAYKGYMKK